MSGGANNALARTSSWSVLIVLLSRACIFNLQWVCKDTITTLYTIHYSQRVLSTNFDVCLAMKTATQHKPLGSMNQAKSGRSGPILLKSDFDQNFEGSERHLLEYAPLLYESDNFLGREKHNSKPNPATNHAHSSIRAGEHQRQELVALSKHNLMDQRTVRDQWYAYGNVERITPVE